jgi:LCP family protein required for cell wall assembly
VTARQRPAGRSPGAASERQDARASARRQGRQASREQARDPDQNQRGSRSRAQRGSSANAPTTDLPPTRSAFSDGLLLPLESGRTKPQQPSADQNSGLAKPPLRPRRPSSLDTKRQVKGPKRALALTFVLGIGVGYGLVGPFGALVGAGLAKLGHPGNLIGSMAPPVATGNHRVLVLGTDQVSGNTDSLFTLHLDDGKTELTQVPRDTYIESDQFGPIKANALYANGGIPLVKQELSKLLSAPVDHYIFVNLNAVQHLGDALGGVEVDVPKRMLYTDRTQGLAIDLYPGRQSLKGKDLEGFLRFRHDGLGDLGRMQRQQLVLNEVFRKLANPAFVTRLPELLKIAGTDIKTDLSPLQIGGLLSAMGTTKLNIQQLTGKPYWHADIDYWMPDINPHHAEYQSQYPEG